jgi:hypothetical protein
MGSPMPIGTGALQLSFPRSFGLCRIHALNIDRSLRGRHIQAAARAAREKVAVIPAAGAVLCRKVQAQGVASQWPARLKG